MNKKELNGLIEYLRKDYQVYGPIFDRDRNAFLIEKIDNSSLIEGVDWGGVVPYYPYKDLILPHEEEILRAENGKISESYNAPKIAIVGMDVLDLRALSMVNQIFSGDPYHQKRRQNRIIVGATKTPIGKENDASFTERYEEEILAHVNFDIFVEKMDIAGKLYNIYTGTLAGQKLLDKFGYKNYKHIQFAGPMREEGKDPVMLEMLARVKNSIGGKEWQELNDRCLACGKCTVVCPTCFCFDLEDQMDISGSSVKIRRQGNCFYPEFSQIATLGGQGFKFLDSVEKRIFFWYYHKFVRIPQDYGIPGCVSCMRCFKVCPVDINIQKVLNSLK